MIPVTQTILHDDPEGRVGNCLQAAVASALNLELDEVPHFAQEELWELSMLEWLKARGFMVLTCPVIRHIPLGVAYGISPRGVMHAVVVQDGAMVFDPHPSRAGLVRVDGAWMIDGDVDCEQR